MPDFTDRRFHILCHLLRRDVGISGVYLLRQDLQFSPRLLFEALQLVKGLEVLQRNQDRHCLD